MSDSPSTSAVCNESFFECLICLEKPSDAQLCRHCSKVFCLSCIHRWLDDHSVCPHCKKGIRKEDLVKCRWAEEFKNCLEKINSTEDKCDKHLVELLFCESCDCCICPICALTGQAHSGHSIKSLSEAHTARISEISDELKSMKEECAKFSDIQNETNRQLDHERTVLIKEIDVFLQKKRENLFSRNENLLSMVRDLKKKLDLVDLKMKTINRLSFIGDLRHLMDDARILLSELQLAKFNHPIQSVVKELSITPPFERIAFQVENIHRSSPFPRKINYKILNATGTKWRFTVYVDGEYDDNGLPLSICITAKMINDELNCIYVPRQGEWDIRIEIKDALNHTTVAFSGECTLNLSELETDLTHEFKLIHEDLRDYVSRDGILRLELLVRPVTYAQKCEDLEQYVKILESEYKAATGGLSPNKNESKYELWTPDTDDSRYLQNWRKRKNID